MVKNPDSPFSADKFYERQLQHYDAVIASALEAGNKLLAMDFIKSRARFHAEYQIQQHFLMLLTLQIHNNNETKD